SVIHLSQFSSRDICTCAVHIGNFSATLCSVYLPPNEDVSMLLNSIESIKSARTGHIIFGGDFNAHHPLWGSCSASQRGNDICDMMGSCDLYLLNTGESPTFFTVRNGTVLSSWIDLSFISSSLLPFDPIWTILDDDTKSDHVMIEIKFAIPSSAQQAFSTRIFNTKIANWDRFRFFIKAKATRWGLM